MGGLVFGVWRLDAGGNVQFYIINSRGSFEVFPSDMFGLLDDVRGGGFYA